MPTKLSHGTLFVAYEYEYSRGIMSTWYFDEKNALGLFYIILKRTWMSNYIQFLPSAAIGADGYYRCSMCPPVHPKILRNSFIFKSSRQPETENIFVLFYFLLPKAIRPWSCWDPNDDHDNKDHQQSSLSLVVKSGTTNLCPGKKVQNQVMNNAILRKIMILKVNYFRIYMMKAYDMWI